MAFMQILFQSVVLVFCFLFLLQARIRALEVQLAAAHASRRSLLGSLCSPPASPPQHAGSPCSEHSIDEDPQDGIATPARLRTESSCDADLSHGSFGDVGVQPSAASSLHNKENASRNAAANGHGSSRAEQACKEKWDDERSELLSLLERLQGQLEARAEQHAATADDSHTARMRSEQQPGCADDGTEGCSQPRVGTPVAAQHQQQQHVPGRAASSPSSSGEASFDSAGGGADGASPTVAAHHMTESPLPSMSAARSGAPSPASVRQQRSASPAASPASEKRPAGAGGQTPVSHAQATEHVPAAHQVSSMQSQPGQHEHQKHKLSSSGSRTLEAFFGRSPSEAAAAAAPAAAAIGQATAAEQQRLQQAEMRAAELEVRRQRSD